MLGACRELISWWYWIVLVRVLWRNKPVGYIEIHIRGGASLVLVAKNPPANADVGSIPGSGRSPGEGNGNPLQYSCLENPIDRGAWRAIVHGVAKSQTQLK